MIILEFLIFVVSSGLFCSEKFRGHIWAVLVAGGIATGSSLLFVYDLGAKLAGHEKPPTVITKTITKPVVKLVKTSQPASAGKSHSCADQYPIDALKRHEEGVTGIGFKILTDGTVDAVKVLSSSGSERLDDAAIKCASNWHYRPAIKDGQLVEADWKASVKWALPSPEAAKELAKDAAGKSDDGAKTPEVAKADAPAAAKDQSGEHHPWYDVTSWFGSSEPDKKAP